MGRKEMGLFTRVKLVIIIGRLKKAKSGSSVRVFDLVSTEKEDDLCPQGFSIKKEN